MEKTTVQVSKETMERLRGCKQHPRESYDEIMNRLIDRHEITRTKGNARELLKYAGILTDKRAEEMEQEIAEGRKRSWKRYA